MIESMEYLYTAAAAVVQRASLIHRQHHQPDEAVVSLADLRALATAVDLAARDIEAARRQQTAGGRDTW